MLNDLFPLERTRGAAGAPWPERPRNLEGSSIGTIKNRYPIKQIFSPESPEQSPISGLRFKRPGTKARITSKFIDPPVSCFAIG